MMDPVGFGTLDDPADPLGGSHIPVVEILCDRRACRVDRGGFNADPEKTVNDQGTEDRVEENLDRMLVEAGQGFQSLRGMVQLVAETPEPFRFMADAVPDIVDQGGNQIGNQHRLPGADSFCQGEHGSRSQPAVLAHSGGNDDTQLSEVDESDPKPPETDRREWLSGPQAFDDDHESGD